jgi:hypothetical protein
MKAPIYEFGTTGMYPLVPVRGERLPSCEEASGGQKTNVPGSYPLITRPAEILPSPQGAREYLTYKKMPAHDVTPRRGFSKGLYVDLWA